MMLIFSSQKYNFIYLVYVYIKCPNCSQFAKTNTVFQSNFFYCKCQGHAVEVFLSFPLKVYFDLKNEEFGTDDMDQEIVFFNGNMEITRTLAYTDIKKHFNIQKECVFRKTFDHLQIDLKN